MAKKPPPTTANGLSNGSVDAAAPASGTNSGTESPVATPLPLAKREPKDVECWGHRGASAHLPENTLASFRAAIKEGCDGIESDVHATSDGVILMFHDPTLDRTTDGKGLIREQPWNGVIEHVRTVKEPIQPIPLFEQLVDLLMEPENQHVVLNIDCKMQNDPEKLFPEMARIVSRHKNWETLLAPRLILGLWHPLFIPSAYRHLPKLKRFHIGFSIPVIRKFFWDFCDGFSIHFPLLVGSEGQAFIKECREKGKEICVWTVNDVDEMKVALSWGIKAVLTDRVGAFTEVKKQVIETPTAIQIPGVWGYMQSWSRWKYYSISHVCSNYAMWFFLRAYRGPLVTFHKSEILAIASSSPPPAPAPAPESTSPPASPVITRPRRKPSIVDLAAASVLRVTNLDAFDEMSAHPDAIITTDEPATL